MATIAIDYTPAHEQGGGIGRYVRELVAALACQDQVTDYRLFVAGSTCQHMPLAPGRNFSWCPTRISPAWAARLWHRAQIPLPVEIFTGHIQLYHATDFVLPPTLRNTYTLLTVHDLSFVRVPETASPKLKKYLDVVVPRSVRRADHILADSEATKQDLIRLYSTPAEKITVLLSGVDPHFKPVYDAEQQTVIKRKYHLDTYPYIFSCGTVQPRKNYGRLIEALAQLHQRGYDLHLVIAGGRGWLEDPIYAKIRELHLDHAVHFIGFADDADLPALYSGARCLAFPSLYEGFGLPILESMACGTPVVTSNVSSLPEVAGDAALMIDPYDLHALTNSLERLIDDEMLRQTLIQAGFKRIQQFTWDTAARQLQQIYEKAIGVLS